MADKSNLDILAELGVEVETKKKAKLTPKEERIIAGFEEIQKFVEEHGHAPQHGEDKDIFERLYAVRLDQIKKQKECFELVKELDHQGLLSGDFESTELEASLDSDADILAELGIEAKPAEDDITVLKHVKSYSEKQRDKADEIGTRDACEDFDKFKPLFEAVQEDINTGRRKTIPFDKDGSIEEGNWFILSGQKAYIASVGEQFIGKDGRKEYRLRVIFDNGVESNQLMRSLQKRLWEDETGRRISDYSYGPLFDNVADDEDLASGTIYVLRSKSDHPKIVENRQIVHKIGVTGGDVKKRIANAKLDPTFLMADVEIVATYELYNINRTKLEKLLHSFFAGVKLNIEVIDRFGHPVIPQEWFLVPLFIIDQVVEKITDGTIGEYCYDVESGSLKL
ncbi:GIY-YIG nuclease family protein [Thiomicrorhabdus indica]|uniref:GIY-YIG nuclease family protein n=1 Tax=Thiomicrorhabdus indica TaxID=2267253 RepID=UPI002AA8AA2B|nr:GIY-YIG nuclease family protein [Thiomicrorhabdus indica]